MADEIDEKIKNALTELRKSKERKFDQTVELIINLQKFDIKKTPINTFITVPYKVKDKKIAGFLEAKKEGIDTIIENDFKKFKDKKSTKKLVKKYDFFIAQASLMPKVATAFGRVLGPAGKMPSPQLGILTSVDEKTIQEIKDKINKSIKIRTKEPSIKVAVGKQSMPDNELLENITTIYNSILKTIPREKENIKNIEIKFTMTKPVKIGVR
ncbi:hypothetical protein K9L16_03735 [Candidatus Pacearchaeota archaeon]|nr:hypothetical protein [Candidatus Pacearchaeota archaeon]